MAEDAMVAAEAGDWAIDPEILRDESARSVQPAVKPGFRQSTSSHESTVEDTSFASTTLTSAFDEDQPAQRSNKRRKLSPPATDSENDSDGLEIDDVESQRQWQSFAGTGTDSFSPGAPFISRSFTSKPRKTTAARGRGRPPASAQGFKPKDILTLARSLPHDSTSFQILQSEEFLSSFDLTDSRLDKLKGSLGKMGRKAEIAYQESTKAKGNRKNLEVFLDPAFDSPWPTTERIQDGEEHLEDELEDELDSLDQRPIISQTPSQRQTPSELMVVESQPYQPSKLSTTKRKPRVRNKQASAEDSQQDEAHKKRRGRPRKPTPELTRPRRGTKRKDPSEIGTHYARPSAAVSIEPSASEAGLAVEAPAPQEKDMAQSPILAIRSVRLDGGKPLREVRNAVRQPKKTSPSSAIYDNLLDLYRLSYGNETEPENILSHIDAELKNIQAITFAANAHVRDGAGAEGLVQRRLAMDNALGLLNG